jgi:hypothetical protein
MDKLEVASWLIFIFNPLTTPILITTLSLYLLKDPNPGLIIGIIYSVILTLFLFSKPSSQFSKES